jgi:outer membrane protein OmpA-like peptidoglycan-associated protein/tetratricopeptide (TPR) repeat protein
MTFNNLDAQGNSKIALQKANQAYRALQFANAATYFNQYLSAVSKIEATPEKNTAVLIMADCYWNLRNYTLAGYWYNQLPASISDTSNVVKYRKAELLATEGKYKEASALLSTIPGYALRAKGYMETDAMRADSADWKLRYLDLNTPYFREFSPLIVNNMFLWSSNELQKGISNGIMGWDSKSYAHVESFSDISYVKEGIMPTSYRVDSVGMKAKKSPAVAQHYNGADKTLLQVVKLPADLVAKRKTAEHNPMPIVGLESMDYNIAHASYSAATGKIYVSMNDQGRVKKANSRMVGIAEAKLDGSKVTDLDFLPLGGKDYSVMHPAIHSNGKLLVYSSNQTGGKGGYDLYYVTKLADSSWTSPMPMSSLNTAGNELFSGFSATGDLYFSTDGHPGFGGMDIYKAELSDDASVKSVYHLPSPVNSQFDDFGFTQMADGKKGFFTSDRFGEDDILAFDYDKKIVKVTGYVMSRYTEARKPGVKVELKKKSADGTFTTMESLLSDANGDFAFSARPNYEYVVKVDNGGDDVQEFPVSTQNEFSAKSLDVIYVDKKKEVVIIEPKPDTVSFIIYFDFDKSKLKDESKVILDEVKALLDKETSFKAMLDGHTDLYGMDNYNDQLSNSRVKRAIGYLEKAGIDKSRLEGAYFGKTRPAIDTKDWKLGVKNRRVEIRVAK